MLSEMIFEIIFLAYVIGLSSSYKKDVIRISIDSNKPRYKEDKNIKIEINEGLKSNKSHGSVVENLSDNYEFYENELKKEIQIITKKNSHEDDVWHSGKILSSVEETDNLWNDNNSHNDLHNEPNSEHYFDKKPYKNTGKTFTRNRNNGIESKETNEYHSNDKVGRKSNVQDSQQANSKKERDYNDDDNNFSGAKNNECEENKCLDNTVDDFDDGVVITAPCNGEAGNLDYQERRASKESDEQNDFEDYSYSVSVQRKGSHYASGALVGERWVLSSAAEFYNVRETIKLFLIRMGSADCKKGGISTAIHSITLHPRFAPGSPSFDIAILRTATPVVTSEVRPIPLTKVSTGRVVRAKYLATYWPRIVIKETVIPQTAAERNNHTSMRLSIQKLVSFRKCQRKVARENISLDENSLCLKPVKAYHSECMPDPGAPVAGNDGLWGITSSWVSPVCPNTTLPTIFTRVATENVRNWIREHTYL